jgi:ketosteroid isomerase-like protein
MDENEKKVRDANEAFYRAFESLDIKEMENVWSRDSQIQCGHPGWRMLCGWDAVMESWRGIFENTPSMRLTLTDVAVEIRGNLAWVTLYENLNSFFEGQAVAAIILTTNIFEHAPAGWRMVLHHGSSVAQQASRGDTPTMH